MAERFCVDQHDVPWVDTGRADDGVAIRVKPLTQGVDTATRVQFIEYPPGHVDPLRRGGGGTGRRTRPPSPRC